ncbi:16S rRNA (adenine(1518)-N(6)/adenine(1519)-N(6))-dimethyltransferase RsmA [Xanthobacter autotrophicus]|uniref:16S rRNA (adenine(1518)-N(6)/adenine(1519)-N(6))- dimethyltransferase RsmA n=1 Tax=Xanthobacter autotrophicus TaxID=280 RepID=UPI00372B0076
MSTLDELPPLRDVIRRHGLSAQKSLGQNFLLDLNLTGRIARASGPLEGASVVEVGPGPGGLTRALLALGAKRVIAIERDQRCLDALAEVAAHYPGRLDVISGDALKVDVRPLVGDGQGGGEVRVVANLPYNIATLLLIGWLSTDPWPPWFSSLTLMFQKEVAERIVATPGSKAYGRLAVLAGWRTTARIAFDVAPSAFVPPPKVTSSVVHLVPRAEPLPCALSALEKVTEAAFGQRRKMLRQSLKSLGVDTAALIAATGVEETARAEEIDVAGFVRLANMFAQLKAGTPAGQAAR